MIVPDANIFIAYFSSKEGFLPALFNQLLLRKEILFSVVAVAEFLVKANKEDVQMIQMMYKESQLISVDSTIMEQAVEYRRQALQKTKRTHLLDCFIAATAKVHKATLLTFDRRDYPFSDITVREPKEMIHNS